MKNFQIHLAVLAAFFFITSCSNDDDNSMDNPNVQLQQTVEANLLSGTWRITEFIDSGINETADFAGYNFTFNANGTVQSTNGTNNVQGTWSLISDGSNINDLELRLIFNTMNDFDDLNDDWDYISQTATTMNLIDVSGGGEPDDLLTFEKN